MRKRREMEKRKTKGGTYELKETKIYKKVEAMKNQSEKNIVKKS